MQTDRRGFMQVLAGMAAWLVGVRARAAEPMWTSEIHQQTRNTRLGPVGRKWWPVSRTRRRTKAYKGHERIALPAPANPGARSLADVIGDFRAADGFAEEALGLNDLSRLLYFTNGVTEPPTLRAAPSAGALYAGEIYLVAERVKGLERGVYYYAPLSHELVPIRQAQGIDAVQRALERPGQIASAPLVVLLTNIFGRYGGRYANRGYRYALIDTGHIGANLRLAARSAGLVDSELLRFHDDRLNALLEIDGRREAVCALHAVGHPGQAKPSPVARTFAETKDAPAGWGSTERYHANTRLADVAQAASKVRAHAPRGRNAKDTLQPEMSVEDSIRNRRSARHFEDRVMRRDALEWILDAAVAHPSLNPVGEVELLLAVHRIADVASGLYRYEPDGARLVLLRKADLRGQLVRSCLGQDKVGRCAVAFFGVGNLQRASETLGDRMYRDLLIEAGGIGQRIYLAAEAAGLTARNLAAFRDDALNRLLDLDGGKRAVLHLTLAGHGS
jgi:SagB-type dehydrogenase family enzyme